MNKDKVRLLCFNTEFDRMQILQVYSKIKDDIFELFDSYGGVTLGSIISVNEYYKYELDNIPLNTYFNWNANIVFDKNINDSFDWEDVKIEELTDLVELKPV